MRKNKSLVAATILASSLIVANTAFADDDTGMYLGVSLSGASADFKFEEDTNFSDSDTAPGIRFGYMFTDMFGAEIGYVDFGNFKAPGDSTANRLNLDASAVSAAFVLNFAVHDQIDLYGKLGAFYVDTRADASVAGQRILTDESKAEAFGTVGIEWDLGQFNLFAEYSKVNTDVNNLTLDLATAGIKIEF